MGVSVALAFGLPSIGGGCAAGEDDTSRSASSEDASSGTDPVTALPPGNPPPIAGDEDADPEDRIAALASFAEAEGFTSVAAALTDGDLTVAERRQGYQDALDCMTSQGMEVVQFDEYDGLHGTEFTFVVGRGSLADAEGARISTECEMQHTALLGQAYSIQHGGRLTDRARAVLAECLAATGITDEIGDTVDEIREVVPDGSVLEPCLAQAEGQPNRPDLPATPG